MWCRLIVLRDVHYRIEAHLEGTDAGVTSGRFDHAEMIARQVHAPIPIHLGRPRFPGEARWSEGTTAWHADSTHIDHGWMLHSIAFAGDRRPRFFRAQSVGGMVHVPGADSALLFG